MESKSHVKRQHILNTATQIILDNDFNALTLDSMAKHACISKGGLLYQFPNKEALIKGLAHHIFEEVSLVFHSYAKNDPIETGKWSRAFIDTAKWDLKHNAKLDVGIFAASY